MFSGLTFFIAGLTIVILCTALPAASKRPATTWNYYHFDGQGFAAGQPAGNRPFLAVQGQVQPVVLSRAVRIDAVALPAGSGALAGICYIRGSAGKISAGSGYLPSPGATITIVSGDTVVQRTITDDSGHFVAVLPIGVYRVSSGAFSIEVTVEAGKTTLAALQAGKRMVD